MYLLLYKYLIRYREDMIMKICIIYDQLEEQYFDEDFQNIFKEMMKQIKEKNKTFQKQEKRIQKYLNNKLLTQELKRDYFQYIQQNNCFYFEQLEIYTDIKNAYQDLNDNMENFLGEQFSQEIEYLESDALQMISDQQSLKLQEIINESTKILSNINYKQITLSQEILEIKNFYLQEMKHFTQYLTTQDKHIKGSFPVFVNFKFKWDGSQAYILDNQPLDVNQIYLSGIDSSEIYQNVLGLQSKNEKINLQILEYKHNYFNYKKNPSKLKNQHKYFRFANQQFYKSYNQFNENFVSQQQITVNIKILKTSTSTRNIQLGSTNFLKKNSVRQLKQEVEQQRVQSCNNLYKKNFNKFQFQISTRNASKIDLKFFKPEQPKTQTVYNQEFISFMQQILQKKTKDPKEQILLKIDNENFKEYQINMQKINNNKQKLKKYDKDIKEHNRKLNIKNEQKKREAENFYLNLFLKNQKKQKEQNKTNSVNWDLITQMKQQLIQNTNQKKPEAEGGNHVKIENKEQASDNFLENYQKYQDSLLKKNVSNNNISKKDGIVNQLNFENINHSWSMDQTNQNESENSSCQNYQIKSSQRTDSLQAQQTLRINPSIKISNYLEQQNQENIEDLFHNKQKFNQVYKQKSESYRNIVDIKIKRKITTQLKNIYYEMFYK